MSKRYLISLLLLLSLPGVVFALGGDDPDPPGGDGPTIGKAEIKNPLGVNTFPELIEKILEAAFIIGLPVAVLFIVIAGFRFVWARGNPSKLEKAKENLLYTIIGIGVFFGAWTLAKVIQYTMSALGVGGS